MQLLRLSEDTSALRRIPFILLDSSNNPVTGQTFSPGDGKIKVSKNNSTQTNHAGTVTELASGVYYYEATSGELDTVGFFVMVVTVSGARVFRALCQVVSFDPYDVSKLGLTGLPAVNGSGEVNLNMAQTVPISDLTAKTTQNVGDSLSAARADLAGKLVLTGTTLTIYGPDDTVVMEFNLNSSTNPTTRQPNV